MSQPSIASPGPALRSLWNPRAEPVDPLVRWLEQKLACRRLRALQEQAVGDAGPRATAQQAEVEVVDSAR